MASLLLLMADEKEGSPTNPHDIRVEIVWGIYRVGSWTIDA